MHPFWLSKMFVMHSMETLETLRSHIRLGKFHDPESNLTATGVPQIVMMHSRFDGIMDRLGGLEDRFGQFERFCGENFEDMRGRFDSLPAAISAHITQNFTIEGQQVGRSDLSIMISGLVIYCDIRCAPPPITSLLNTIF